MVIRSNPDIEILLLAYGNEFLSTGTGDQGQKGACMQESITSALLIRHNEGTRRSLIQAIRLTRHFQNV